MKPIESTITVVDEMDGRVIPYTISEKDAPLIMKSMAGLYEFSHIACAREYGTNARDSHIEAGNPDPIDVTLPTVLHPYFTVKDHGTGMDVQTLEDVYTSFGASTRRDSDEFNGSWGYGSKAALAYTNSFTITAVKDGRQSIGVVTRRENGAMELKLVLEDMPTNERNGVTIQIPVHNINEFRMGALEFYSFWKDGTVLIDGEPNVNTKANWDEILDDNMYMSKDGDSYVVMGNVPYRIANPSSLFPSQAAYIPFVAYVPNGTVQFLPSREALDYTEHTRQALQAIADHYIATVSKRAEKDVKEAKTPWEALKASRKWSHLLNKTFQYKGNPIPSVIEFKNAMGRSQKVWQVHRHWNPVYNTVTIDLDESILVVTNATTSVGTYHRNRLHDWWRNTNRPTAKYVYFTESDTWNNDWINPNDIVSWDKVKAETPPAPRSVAGTRVKGTFDMLLPTGAWDLECDVTNPKFWVEHHFAKSVNWGTIATSYGITDDVVIVPANRVVKFNRDYPSAMNVREFLKTQVDLDGDAMYNDDQRSFFSLPYYHKQVLVQLDSSKVDDPDLARLIDLSKRKDILKPAHYDSNRSKARILSLPFKDFSGSPKETEEVAGRYKLIDWSNNYHRLGQKLDHVYVYINAAYAARKDGTL